ncbi:MAG: hypothetical protein R3224_04515 [Balneolaceae bacterium]|nr:hypothetical protein [Balneolaceae bacterium]
MNTNITNKAGLLLLALAALMAGCNDDNGGPVNSNTGPCDDLPAAYSSLPGTLICEDEIWANDTTLAGPHFVVPGVTLTVNAGVTVSFEYHNNVSDEVGTIIALPADNQNFSSPRPTARLVAEGTASNPIVFTSAKSEPARNDWGGIILGGRASNNVPGGIGNMEGLDDAINYGGDFDADDSGSLEYVRIEYSGYSIAEGSEIQGLTLYSVGSGTNINHINIYENSDDGIEIFGGTVDLKYVVVYGADDDSYDYDQGWQGRGQFWLAVQKPNADNGFENDGCDNISDCNWGNGPTSPQVYNMTVVGAGSSDEENRGLRLREDLQGSYNNFIVTDFVGAPFVLEGGDQGENDPTYGNYPDQLSLSGFVVWQNGNFEDKSAAGGDATEPDATRYANSYESFDPMFTDPANYDFSLQAQSPALSGGETPPGDGFFDTDATWRGAFGTVDWAAEGSWVRWPDN